MTRSNKLFNTPAPVSTAYDKATKVNNEGFPAFERTLEEDTLAVLLTNTLSNTFYVSEKELAAQTVDVLTKMAKKDAAFLAKALVYARNTGLMRLAPIVGLIILSAHETGKKINFRQAFHQVIRTPDDLREFVTLCRAKGEDRKNKFRSMGGEARDAVKRWMQHLTEYHAVKYGSDKSEGITLRDIVRMSHPRPVNDAQRELFGWLVKGWENVGPSPSPSNPMVWALEKIKRSDNDKEIVALVEKYHLTWEVVVPSVKKMSPAIWKALLKDMPYMALLRNLNTMERNEVFKDKDMVKAVAEKLALPENVARSKQLPFRFFNAFQAFTGAQPIRDALAMALEQAFVNVQELGGRVCIAPDTSGSMGSQISDKGTTRYADVAGLLAGALFKKSPDVMVLPFDTEVHPNPKISRISSLMDVVKTLAYAGGGTDIGAPIRHLMQKGEKIDVFIGITDGEDWAGRGFLTDWKQYTARINPKAQAFLITIAPYRNWNAPTDCNNVHFIMGWSDAVLKYISLVMKGKGNQVEEIRKMDLSQKAKMEEAEKSE